MAQLATKPRRPMADLSPAQQAGILCNDAEFQRFAAARCDLPGLRFASEAAAEFLRRECQIDSRRDLTTNPAALTRFDTLRTDFDAWRGRIAAQRSDRMRA